MVSFLTKVAALEDCEALDNRLVELESFVYLEHVASVLS